MRSSAGFGLLLVIMVPDLFDEGEFRYSELAGEGGTEKGNSFLSRNRITHSSRPLQGDVQAFAIHHSYAFSRWSMATR